MRPYPGATSQILIAGKSQPALYGPMLGGFLFNPATIEEQGISPFQSEISEISAFYLGQLCSIGLMFTGLEQIDPVALNALALAGFTEFARSIDITVYGPPELLYVSVLPPAGSEQNGWTDIILPGVLWNAPECFCGSIYVRAATVGHRFTSVVFQNPVSYPPTPISGTFPPNGPSGMQNALLAYLYQQYSDDNDLQGFVLAYNIYVQLFINWFNTINLPIYTALSGALLDWVAQGLYGIIRPTLFSDVPQAIGPLATTELATIALAMLELENNISNVAVTSDDIFKRIITWHFYKGDGKNISTSWIRARITRFMFGVNGADFQGPFPTLSIQWTENQLSITIVSDWSTCTYSGALMSGPLADAPFAAFAGVDNSQAVPAAAPQFMEAVETGALEMPVQYSTTVRIGPKGTFGNLSLTYSGAAL